MDYNPKKNKKMSQTMKRIWNWMKDNRSLLGSISSIVLSIATLVISFFMLKVANSSLASAEQSRMIAEQSRMIAEQSLILSSKDFEPVFEFDINNETGDVLIKNQFSKLFSIESFAIYKITERGFELANNDSLVSFSLLTNNSFYPDYHFQLSDDSVTIIVNLNTSIQLASSQKVYDQFFIERIDSYLDAYYSLDSKKGYALPSLYSTSYLLEINYRDRLGQVRTAYMIQDHYHGYGWWKQTIDKELFQNILKQAEHKEIESMNDIDSIMNYFVNNCKIVLD